MNASEYIDINQYLDSLHLPDDVLSHVSFVNNEYIKNVMKTRPQFSHKGTFGHALLMAGHDGMAGAALLSARASFRTGVGKLTVYTLESNRIIIQLGIPEAIISICDNSVSDISFSFFDSFNAVAIGPGIGTGVYAFNILKKLVESYEKPIVVDADAINIISENKNFFNNLPPYSILTPHKLELSRLVGVSDSESQELTKAITLSNLYNVIVVIKGCFTKIVMPDGSVFLNTTGNPGMATAGSGDVLTGILLSLLAQKYKPQDAACIGVFLHGLAGDIAADKLSQYSVIASDIVDNIPFAFKSI